MELPAFTALREAKVPTPNGMAAVSPPTTVTQSRGMPRASAAIWAKDVSCPCPWLQAPVAPPVPPAAPSPPRAPPSVEPPRGPLVGPDGRAFHIAGEADAAIHALGAQLLLLRAKRVVARGGQRRLEARLEISAVVDERVAVAIRQVDLVRQVGGR